jgi:hypothetical protein
LSNNISDQEHHVLKSINLKKIILPVAIGVVAIILLMIRNLSLDELSNIHWDSRVFFWLGFAVFLYVLRHLFYAWRLRMMTDNAFGWGKSIELIFVWEFSSAVSPSSIGGAGVALFFLSQENLTGAKTVSVVLYSMVQDTIFMILSLVVLFVVLGPSMIRPDMNALTDLDGYGYTFIGVVLFMAAYSFIFFYGLFINPIFIKRFFLALSKWRIFGRFKKNIRQTALDIVSTSKEMSKKSMHYHFMVFVSTAGAWITRFLALNCIIIALVITTPLDFWNQLMIFARGETMHNLTAFSPTPGGAGVTELLFGGFFADYISEGISSLLALVWRLITYYPYLIIGLFVIPNWIRKIITKRAEEADAALLAEENLED